MEFGNVEMLRDTLEIFERGTRRLPEGDVPTMLTLGEASEARVLLPGELSVLQETRGEAPAAPAAGRCDFRCARMDSFAMARLRAGDMGYAYRPEGFQDIWVLNFANAVRPGGGVRNGAAAQEEDLCRASSLLWSLEREAAREYYHYNRRIGSSLGSSAVVLTPKVEIVKYRNGEPLPQSTVVSVITCAAPVYQRDTYGLGEEGYREMFRTRIDRLLLCAAAFGCRHLVLGAFGCGAFGNDPEMVAELFRESLLALRCDGRGLGDLFREIDFAVLDTSRDRRNINAFHNRFTNETFYGEG